VTSNTVRIVCGNESADLDSVTSAISYAYFRFVENSKDAQPIIPIINITKDDLKLRRDIIHVLNDVNIDEDLLFFLDDVKQWQESNKTIEAVLVDHNEVVNEVKKYITKVVGVVDHHKDMGLYLDASPRIIQVCGSCTSLVYNYFVNEILPKSYQPGHDVTQLCLAAGLVDTTNFSHRVEHADSISKELYSKYAPDIDMDKYTKIIKNAKNDISGFTARDLLRKDYKQFEFSNTKGVHEGKLIMGISSIVKPMGWLYEEFGGRQGFKEECIRYREEKDIDILTIMTSFVQNGKFQRQMTLIPSDEVKSLAKDMISNIEEYLKLEKPDVGVMGNTSGTLVNDEEFQQYEQQNIEASRKQVAPSLEMAFQDL